jgi:putative transposase
LWSGCAGFFAGAALLSGLAPGCNTRSALALRRVNAMLPTLAFPKPKEIPMEHDDGMRIALWRYEIVAPLMHLDGRRGALRRAMTRLASTPHIHPGKGTIAVGCGTLEEWLYRFKKDGLDGLRPKVRSDKGKSRVLSDEACEKILELKETRSDLDGNGLLAELKSAGVKDKVSLSTLYRFLRAQGLNQNTHVPHKDHRAYAFDLAGDCWQMDVMYGPSLPQKDGRLRPTYLIALIDDATRLILHAQFYFDQHLRCLKDSLKQAFLKRGLPRRLYVDNGQIFRSRLLLQVGARLGIHILHTRPYQPQGRAKLERWFRRVRRSFLARVDLKRVPDLDALNRLLFAWVEGEYHVQPHRGLEGESPLDRYLRLSESLRSVPKDIDLDRLFLEQVSRRIKKDGTFTVKNVTFEAGPEFISQRLVVRFDPFDLRSVLLQVSDERFVDAFPVNRAANRHVRRRPVPETPPREPPPLRSLDDLAKRMDPTHRPPQDNPPNNGSNPEAHDAP